MEIEKNLNNFYYFLVKYIKEIIEDKSRYGYVKLNIDGGFYNLISDFKKTYTDDEQFYEKENTVLYLRTYFKNMNIEFCCLTDKIFIDWHNLI